VSKFRQSPNGRAHLRFIPGQKLSFFHLRNGPLHEKIGVRLNI
jgi:hypothetical protein